MNGSSTNGHSATGIKPASTYFGHDREEVTRILIQALSDLGYKGAAGALSQESGYDLESPTVAAFRNAVLQGEWAEAEELLFGGSTEEGGVSIHGNGLILRDGVDKNFMRFWIRQQKFLELLEQKDMGRAINVLRSELTPLDQDTPKLHFLSSLLMCTPDDLKTKANWDGAAGESRKQLLSQLSSKFHVDATGKLMNKLPRFSEPVTCCVWAPDGQSFVIGSLGNTKNLCQWSLNGDLVYDWGREHRIRDIAMTPDGNKLVAIEHMTHIYVYNFVTRELEYELDLKVQLCSISISQNSRHLLVHCCTGETRMLDVETGETVRSFISGDKGGEFIIRSSFGGANESFVVSGSEEGNVIIYHRENGAVVEKLEGHKKGCCNAISWNPTNPAMFASAGDDDGRVKTLQEDP
ncbi:hypothetical protein SS1G_03788 [Sclerotinia sclerotiorum 1980 UF-70]|uniref:CTLH domain-containing protein n=1 Tax=Sclerotinia sclerotiorum (strain ATCC 18683 / 1980 / Ss-1) TaxID=665079 RepID=A7EEP8_SCLS1|nr:hypothetical protein SS1G_03788 [Sclerotinia sclerotiorum 1980 UF-70]EDO01314.1 hypothetical protein SS1G_03788 [Sclerotinia sclerotiorum 1980 UF-70]